MADIDLSQFENESGAAAEALRRLRTAATQGTVAWDDFNDNMIDWGGNIKKSSLTLDKLAQSVKSASGTFKDSMGVLSSGFRKIGQGNASLSGFIDDVGDSVSKFADSIPAVGGIIGGMAVAVTGAAAGLISFTESLVDTNKELINSGIYFKNNIDVIKDAASDARMSISDFSNVILANMDSLRVMAGGAPGGIKAVSKGFRDLYARNRDFMNQYYEMGYTQEDVAEAMIRTATRMSLAGMDNVEIQNQLAASTEKYLKSQRELSLITGTSVKTLKERAEADRANFTIQEALNKLTGDQRVAMETLVNSLGTTEEKLAALGKTSMNTEYAASQLPSYFEVIRKAGDEIRDGQVKSSDVAVKFSRSMSDAGDAIMTDIRNAQQRFGTVDSSFLSGAAASVREITETTSVNARERVEASKAFLKNQDAVASSSDTLSKSIVTIESFSNVLKDTVNSLGVVMTTITDKPINSFLESLRNGTGNVGRLSDAFTKYQEAMESKDQARIDAETKNLHELWDKTFDETVEFITKSAETVFAPLSKVISDGLLSGFDQVLDSVIPGYYSSVEQINDAFNAIKNAQLKGGTISDSSVEDALSYLQDNELDQLNRMLKSNNMNLSISREKIRGTARFGGVYTRDGFKATKNAYGNIIEPSVGGSLNIVGEAGRHEAILPLERSNGDLGVKMTGKIIDDSKTMPALLEQLKNNNTLTSAVVELLKNMLTAIERNNQLVRQGNMLAN